MIFFGSRGKVIQGHVIEGIECPNCDNKEFITFGVLRYFHLYWIPTFITSKKAGMECTHCKKSFFDKEIPKDLSKEIKGAVFTKKKIVPMFSGLILLACVALFLTYSVYQEKMHNAAYIEQPMVNDLYVFDFNRIYKDSDSEYKYGIMRIKSMNSSDAEFQVGQMAYSKVSGAKKDIRNNKVYADAYYGTKSVYISLFKLKEMKESGIIKYITRN